jgi:spermidine synthase
MARWLFMAMGFHALLAQVILLREMLVVLAGHEICLGMILASWLMGVFAGAWGATRMREPAKAQHQAVCWLLGISPILTMVLVLAVRLLRAWIPTTPGAPLPALGSVLAIVGFLVPQGALVGAMFPLASALAARWSCSQARAIGQVYSWEAVGCLLGGLAITFLMIPHLHPPGIVAWGGMLSGLLAAWAMARLDRACARGLGLLGSFWALLLLSGGSSSIQQWSAQRRWEAIHPGMERLTTVDTPYQSLELGALQGQFTLFGNGRPLVTFPDPVEAAPLAHIIMGQEPQPRRLLLIGGGPGSILPLFLQYPVEVLELVELDSAVFRLAGPFLTQELRSSLDDPRLRVHYLDARLVLPQMESGSFDAVVVQMPDPSTTLLNRFHTLEFFQSLSRILGPRGILLHSVTGSVHYLGPELERFLGMIHGSLRLVFPEVRVVPGERTLFLAGKMPGSLSLDPEVLASRQSLGEPIPSGLFHMWIQPQQVQIWEEALGRSQQEPNLDEHPRSTLYFLALWERLLGTSFGARQLRGLEGVSWGWILGVLGALLGGSLLGRPGIVWGRTPLLALGVTGCTAMAQEMVCLYLYQAVWGQLYSRVGLLVGIFMAGLAAGAWWAGRIGNPSRNKAMGMLMAVQLGMGVLCASIPFLWVGQLLARSSWQAPGLAAQLGVCLWMLLAGLATGGSFPLACAVLGDGPSGVRVKAGVASAWDHLGAALGALLGGVALVPSLGLARTGLVLAGLQGIVVVLLGGYFLAGMRRRG